MSKVRQYNVPAVCVQVKQYQSTSWRSRPSSGITRPSRRCRSSSSERNSDPDSLKPGKRTVWSVLTCFYLFSPVLTCSHLLSPVYTCFTHPHHFLPVLTCFYLFHLSSPVVTCFNCVVCPHQLLPVLTCPNLFSPFSLVSLQVLIWFDC